MSSLLWLIAVTSSANAGSVFATSQGPITLDLSGNWPRAYPEATGGWVMFHAGGGEFHVSRAFDDLSPNHSRDKRLTGRTDLKDHDIRPCPDGSWLQVSTADTTGEQAHDSAYSWRYDADFNVIASGVIAEGDLSGPTYVDLPVACGTNFQGTSFPDDLVGTQARFASVEADGSAPKQNDLPGAPRATGASMMEDTDGTLYMVGFLSEYSLREIVISHYDTEFRNLNTRFVQVAEEGFTPYWAQTLIRVGDFYIVAHMMRNNTLQWTQQEGDLYLTAFDLNWEKVDQLQLSRNTAPLGGMQPYVVDKGDGTLLALYSKELYNYAFIVDLQPGVEISDPGTDTGTDTATDSGAGDDGSGDVETGETPEPVDCECAATPGASGLLALVVAGAALTRRRGGRVK